MQEGFGSAEAHRPFENGDQRQAALKMLPDPQLSELV